MVVFQEFLPTYTQRQYFLLFAKADPPTVQFTAIRYNLIKY